MTDGEPRYQICRLTRRRFLSRWGVMCGNGTYPLYRTWSRYRALLVCELLMGACADGAFIAKCDLSRNAEAAINERWERWERIYGEDRTKSMALDVMSIVREVTS